MLTRIIQSRSTASIIIWSGLIVGTLDILAAIYFSGASAEAVLKFIASGLFGREKVAEVGAAMIWWGILFHYLIAYFWTTVFFYVFPRVFSLVKMKVVMAMLMGLTIWLVMNRVVLPMSAIQQGAFTWTGFAKGTAILVPMIGVPLTWIFHSYHYGRDTR